MANRPFARYAWLVVAYNLAVVVWGAYVRATSSGAGCGAHWPLCDGEVVPTAPQLTKLIEFTHRASSGVEVVLILGLLLWAWRAYSTRSPIFRAAALATLFIFTEALIGAALVLFGLVNQNTSALSLFMLSLHMANTLLLLAALTLTAARASGIAGTAPGRGPTITAACGIILTAILGTLSALGDSVYPSTSVAQGLHADFASTGHALTRIRILHPALAIAVGAYLIYLAMRPRATSSRLSALLIAAVLLQWCLGILDVSLLAPTWLQLTHLFTADLVWIAFVLFTSSAHPQPTPPRGAGRAISGA